MTYAFSMHISQVHIFCSVGINENYVTVNIFLVRVPTLESQCKESIAISIKSSMMNKEMLRPVYDLPWSGSVLRFSFSALTLLVG